MNNKFILASSEMTQRRDSIKLGMYALIWCITESHLFPTQMTVNTLLNESPT